jgi:hypothetical protein
MPLLEPHDDDAPELAAAWHDLFALIAERAGRPLSPEVRDGFLTLVAPMVEARPNFTPLEQVRLMEAQIRKTLPYMTAPGAVGLPQVPSLLGSALTALDAMRHQLERAERQGRIDRSIGIAGFIIGIAGLVVTLL